jgi:membrane protease subunit (stomatin/prohibitin family)
MSEWIEVIQAVDLPPQVLVYRYPQNGSANIKMGAQLIVNENQEAVFFRDGKALDTFNAGRHTLTTANIPFLTKLLSLPFGFDSPFKAAVYFVSKSTVTDMKWGTPEPILFRDKDFAMVRLRAHGTYTLRVVNSQLFIGKLAATSELVTTASVDTLIRSVIVSKLTDLLGEIMKSIFDLPKLFEEIGIAMAAKVKEDLEKYGIELGSFYVLAITPPEEVQKMIDERTSMAVLGDMNQYMKFKTAKAVEESAKNPGGAAASGIGIGMGAGLGMMMPGMMRDAMSPGGVGAGSSAGPGTGPGAQGFLTPVACAKCGKPNTAEAKFCANCGSQMAPAQPATVTCPKCGTGVVAASKFCSNCGEDLGPRVSA